MRGPTIQNGKAPIGRFGECEAPTARCITEVLPFVPRNKFRDSRIAILNGIPGNVLDDANPMQPDATGIAFITDTVDHEFIEAPGAPADAAAQSPLDAVAEKQNQDEMQNKWVAIAIGVGAVAFIVFLASKTSGLKMA